MPLLVNSVPNLAQGVSQQPDNLRFPGQCDEQINAWATVVEGLVKRPPTEYTKKINSSSTNADKLFTHFVKRSEQNKYCVAVSLGGIGVINVGDGTSVSIAVTSIANSYLSLGGQASLGGVANPLSDLRALTVADYTFLVNKNRTVEKSYLDGKSAIPGDEHLIVVKLGDFQKNYTIYLDDKVIPSGGDSASNLAGGHTGLNSSQTPSSLYTYQSDTTAHPENVDTSLIAEDLAACLIASTTASDNMIGLSITDGGTGWFSGYSTGLNPNLRPNWSVELKLEMLVQQPGARSSLFELIVKSGVVTGFKLVRKGGDFDLNSLGAITQTFTVYKKSIYGDNWSYANRPGEDRSLSSDIFFDEDLYDESGTTITYNFGSGLALDIEQKGSIVKVSSPNGPIKVRVEDGLADQALGVIYREVDSITDLPIKCYEGFGPVKVIGDVDIDQDDYYVQFSTKEKEDFGEGSWIETVGYYQDKTILEGIDVDLNLNSMPVTLVPYFNNSDIVKFRLQTPNEALTVKHNSNYYLLIKDHRGSSTTEPGVGADWEEYWRISNAITQGYLDWELDIFYYGAKVPNKDIGWSARKAGDDNTNPFPSFVGKRIRDIFFFKNRLGILTDSNVIFSEADEYFNFFRTTTQQLLDSAVIDVGLSHTKVAILEHAVPFQEKLMLFSQGSQFVLRGADVLSPRTVAISPVTEYDLSDGIQPVALGNYIYFPFKRNDFEGVYEYFVDNNTETFNSEEITQQIPKYITSDIQKMVGSQAENTIVMSTTADPKTLFVYKYFWSNKEKVQSAWMKFTFERDVRGFDFIDSNLHLITADTGGLHLEKLTLEDGLSDDGLDYTLYLDSKKDGSSLTVASYNPATKVTRVSGIPYDTSGISLYTKQGNERTITIVDSSTVDVSGSIASYVDHGGSYVSYEGVNYYCIESHTSTSTFESQKWRKATNPPGVVDLWAASTVYTQGTIYKCDKNHTSPTTFSTTINTDTVWSSSSEVLSAMEWVASKFYNNDQYFFVGKPYNMLYRFSDQTLKQPTERGGRSASDYAYQTIRNGSINYADTGHFTVEVTAKFRDTYSYAFNPDIVGANLTLNQFTPQNGHFRFPVQAQPNEATIEVKSDSALPVKLLGAEFESMFIPRSRRYGA